MENDYLSVRTEHETVGFEEWNNNDRYNNIYLITNLPDQALSTGNQHEQTAE